MRKGRPTRCSFFGKLGKTELEASSSPSVIFGSRARSMWNLVDARLSSRSLSRNLSRETSPSFQFYLAFLSGLSFFHNTWNLNRLLKQTYPMSVLACRLNPCSKNRNLCFLYCAEFTEAHSLDLFFPSSPRYLS